MSGAITPTSLPVLSAICISSPTSVVVEAAVVDSVTAELAGELPTLFTARTWKVYSVSAVRLEIVTDVAVELVSVHVPPAVEPVVKRYWYSVIAAPPVSVGAVP